MTRSIAHATPPRVTAATGASQGETEDPMIASEAPVSPRRTEPPAAERAAELAEAVQRYFGLMHSCDASAFETAFSPTVQLHGYRGGEFVVWPAAEYREVLRKRRSPQSLGAARRDEILLMDFASDTMAFTKVRVRIVATDYVDYLTWHRVEGRWVITSKGYHVEAGPA